jgi:Predicted phosphatases
MDTLIQPFDNMDKLLSALKKSGYKLGVTTSKHILKAKSCLTINGIIEYFDFIAGSIPEKNIFRKCDVLGFAAKEYGVDLNEAVLVGDTRFDMEGAEIMDIDCIGVTYWLR